jgi:hypothetical protein
VGGICEALREIPQRWEGLREPRRGALGTVDGAREESRYQGSPSISHSAARDLLPLETTWHDLVEEDQMPIAGTSRDASHHEPRESKGPKGQCI